MIALDIIFQAAEVQMRNKTVLQTGWERTRAQRDGEEHC